MRINVLINIDWLIDWRSQTVNAFTVRFFKMSVRSTAIQTASLFKSQSVTIISDQFHYKCCMCGVNNDHVYSHKNGRIRYNAEHCASWQTVHNDLVVAAAAYPIILTCMSIVPCSLTVYRYLSQRRLTSILRSRQRRRTSPAYMHMYYYYLSAIMRTSCWLQPRNSPVDTDWIMYGVTFYVVRHLSCPLYGLRSIIIGPVNNSQLNRGTGHCSCEFLSCDCECIRTVLP